MSKKHIKHKQSEENLASKLEQAKAKRLENFKKKNQEKTSKESLKEDFRKFFLKAKNKLSLDESLEGVLWLHFKAYNFDSKDKFEQGLKHFGIR